jgi:hypothetical protein
MAVCRGGGSGVRVGLFVMMMGEMVKCLNIGVGEGVEANPIVTGAVKVLQDVEG